MDILDEELLNFWKTLNLHQVEYIMVGGFATLFHGFDRTTEDVDIYLIPSRTVKTSGLFLMNLGMAISKRSKQFNLYPIGQAFTLMMGSSLIL